MSDVITTTILSGSQQLPYSHALVYLDVSKVCNRISRAELSLVDGDSSDRNFAISDSDDMKPGEELTIKLRYEGKPDSEQTVFKGLVVKHRVISGPAGNRLTITLKDASVLMTSGSSQQFFKQMTDDQIIKKVVESYQSKKDLKVGTLASTSVTHDYLVQYQSSDWDFILNRAQANALVLITDDGTLQLTDPMKNNGTEHSYDVGIDRVLNFDMELDVERQKDVVQCASWDSGELALSSPVKAQAVSQQQGNLQAAAAGQAMTQQPESVSTFVNVKKDELQALADAENNRRAAVMIRGTMTVPGNGEIKPGDVIDIKGVGKRFNGKTMITAIRHQLDSQGWRTTIQFGLKSIPVDEDVSPASSVRSLQVGVVAAFKEDPDNAFRVPVLLPGIDDPDAIIWARVGSGEAGKQRGTVSYPLEGDEVILGFFNDDPRQAVILGSLFGPKNQAPKAIELNNKNSQRGWVTAENLMIMFDDDKKSITMQTSDQNRIVLDEDGILLQSGKDIQIKVDGKSTVQSSGAMNINTDANLTIKAGGNADIEASGTTTIKGATVNLN